MATKLLLVKSEKEPCDCQEECYCEPILTTQEFDLTDFVHNAELRDRLPSIVETAIKSKNPAVLAVLKKLGYVNKDAIEDRMTKLEAEKKIFAFEPNSAYAWASVSEVDLDNLSDHDLQRIAKKGMKIVQAIDKNSLKGLLTEDQKKKYSKALEQNKLAEEKLVLAKKAKEEAKKQKEIEKAKKILAEAGA